MERRASEAPAVSDDLEKAPARAAKSGKTKKTKKTGSAAAGGKPAARRTRRKTEAERLRQAEMLLNLSRKVAAIESLDEVLATLVEMTTWEMGAERGTLFLNDDQTGELYSRFAQGKPSSCTLKSCHSCATLLLKG